jgi:hypothetical protein
MDGRINRMDMYPKTEEIIEINHQLYLANQEWSMVAIKELAFNYTVKQIRLLFKELFADIKELDELERMHHLLKLVKEGRN